MSANDGLITRAQALVFLTPEQLRAKLRSRWQRVLPGVYATFTGQLTERQRIRAALLYGGAGAVLSDRSVLNTYRVRYLPAEPQVYLLINQSRGRRSRDFVRIRRTHRPPHAGLVNGLPMCPPERALVEFALRCPDERTVRAVMADAVQRRIVLIPLLRDELRHLPACGSAVVRRVADDVMGGVRSAPEHDFVSLVARSPKLPRPSLNVLLQLPCGRKVSPDALFKEAALIHETNGRVAHEDEDLFESMQERHDVMTAAGFTVLHNSPRQIRIAGRRILTEVETCYERNVGRGLPEGVVILRDSAA